MTQDAQTKDNKVQMVMYDPENAYAWQQILNKVRKLYAEGHTQLAISQLMGVSRDTVGRWLSEERGGERTTFGAMLRYADALKIPYNTLLRNGSITTEKHQLPASAFSKAVGKILEGFAKDDEMTITDIAQQSNMLAMEVNAALAGETQLSIEQFHHLCKAIEVKATVVLNRAEKTLKEDTTAKAERSA